MPVLKDYDQTKVHQTNKQTGCIPASIEWLLRYNNINIGASWDDFQNEVDCDPNNNFTSVPEKIEEVYPHSKNNFEVKDFENPQDKFDKIKKLIDSGKGCIVSVANPQGDSCHIMPAVEYNDNKLVLLNLAEPIGKQRKEYTWKELEFRHNNLGGRDILWLS